MNESQPPVRCERDGHIAVVTLNRPHRRNALDGEAKALLADIWADIDRDSEVRVVVVTAAGERAFCVGADLTDMSGQQEPGGDPGTYPPAIYSARHAGVYKPVITAVNGMCAGGGLHFVADTDICIAAESATFFDPHVNVGQVAALEPIGLSRRMPLGAVLRMVLMGNGERIDARRALELGLVSEVTPDGGLLDRAMSIAGQVAKASPAAVEQSLRAIWEGLEGGLEDALRQGWERVLEHRDHPDASEGPSAFSEKREPVWRDR